MHFILAMWLIIPVMCSLYISMPSSKYLVYL